MRTIFAILCLVPAVAFAVFLLINLVRALRGTNVKTLRSAAVLVLMISALSQAYVLSPALTARFALFCIPGGIAGALLILVTGVRGTMDPGSGDGPQRRVPAMAMRAPQAEEEEENLRFAAGGGRVA